MPSTHTTPLVSSDAVVLGLLIGIIWLVFTLTRLQHPFWKRFFSIFPPILLCYFLPSVLQTTGIIQSQTSQVYPIVSQYLLPVCLILFTLSVDFQSLKMLGPKALWVFLGGTFGVIVGGPLALAVVKFFKPEAFLGTDADATWRGLATIAGSWIGGGPNQTALKEIFQPSATLFSQTVTVDILVAEAVLAVILYAVGHRMALDKWLQADTTLLDQVKERVKSLPSNQERRATFYDYVQMLGVGFVGTALAHATADFITPIIQQDFPKLAEFSLTSRFFWIILVVTVVGILASFTRLRLLEQAGASTVGSFFLYLLIASIGMQMDLASVVNSPWLFVVGILWMVIHLLVIFLVARWVKAPFFFLAVGSQANIGGAASAPVVAAAFHPSLVTVGVLLAVLGYTIGTYGGYICALLMQWVYQSF